jgi:galactarate dehydratase
LNMRQTLMPSMCAGSTPNPTIRRVKMSMTTITQKLFSRMDSHRNRSTLHRLSRVSAATIFQFAMVRVQCGGSDAFSGVTANPAVGYCTDLLVRAGASVLFSEVTEVRDGIALLVSRAATASVARSLLREMAWYDAYLARGGADRGANTTPGNKRGGLSNIVEKAMGSIVKSGSTPIVDVLRPGERLRQRGLNFAATPWNSLRVGLCAGGEGGDA